MTRDALKMVLFDFETGKWSDLIENMTLDFPSWSKDGKYLYFLHSPENLAVLRIRVRDRKIEQVADLKGFVPTGWWGKWLGLDPETYPSCSGTREGRMFIRLTCIYKEKFAIRPISVEMHALTLGSIDDPDGFGVGHLPLSCATFGSWLPDLFGASVLYALSSAVANLAIDSGGYVKGKL
jgi:hypothetical protein